MRRRARARQTSQRGARQSSCLVIYKKLVALAVARLASLPHKLSRHGLVFAIADSGGLFEKFALFPFADNAFLLYHALEAFDCLLKWLIVVDHNLADKNHPPSSVETLYQYRESCQYLS